MNNEENNIFNNGGYIPNNEFNNQNMGPTPMNNNMMGQAPGSMNNGMMGLNNQNQPMNNMNFNNQTNQMMNNPSDESKPKNKKKLFIIIGAVLVVVIIVLILAFSSSGSGGSFVDKIEVVNSKFESSGNGYVLKDEDGNVLLKDIDRYGTFVVGTTYVRNNKNEYAIIDGKGKQLVEYGKYKKIRQLCSWGSTCYGLYEAETDDQSFYLKYDGSVLYKDDNDKNLYTVSNSYFTSSENLFTIKTKEKEMIYNNYGVLLKEFMINKDDKDKEGPVLLTSDSDYYDIIFYENKSYVFNSITGKELMSGEGYYFVRDENIYWITKSSGSKENKTTMVRIIVHEVPLNLIRTEEQPFYGTQLYSEGNGNTYVYENDKLLFKLTGKCDRESFNNSDHDVIECYPYEGDKISFDIEGNEIK